MLQDLFWRLSSRLSPSPEAGKASSAATFLAQEIERLLMVSEAMWRLMKEKHGFVDEDLARMVEKVDLQDGKLDGRVARQPPAKCPRCARFVQRGRQFCIYCHGSLSESPFRR